MTTPMVALPTTSASPPRRPSHSGTIVLPGTSLEVPGYLVPLAFLYAGAGTLLGWRFGRPLVRSTNALQTAEADFRFGLARAREHSEAIALMQGEAMERAGARARFARILREWHRQSVAFMGIVGFSTGYSALLPVFPLLIAAPQYIAGVMSLGMLMQAAQAFQKLTTALSWPIDNLGDIARTRASADRVISLWEDMRKLDRDARQHDGHRILLQNGPSARLVIEDLCIAEPNGRILVEGFNCRVNRGERLLVTGDPAVTSSLFKVIGGLWPWGSGSVVVPEDGASVFMPQRPFLPEGRLRAALCYPRPETAWPTAEIEHALECAGIAWLAPRLNEPDNWEAVLPPRAQQRLGFARVLLQRPAWIFMEEATDAFDPRSEQMILEMLHRELPSSGMLTISFHAGAGCTAPPQDRAEPLARGEIPLRATRPATHRSSLKTRRQPAAFDTLAKTPGGRGLGAITPEKPARVTLEGKQLRSSIGTARDILLEGIHVLERMVVRARSP